MAKNDIFDIRQQFIQPLSPTPLIHPTLQLHPTNSYLNNLIHIHINTINTLCHQLHHHNPSSYLHNLYLHLHHPPSYHHYVYLHLRHNNLHHKQLQQPRQRISMVSYLIDIQAKCSSTIFTLNYVRQTCRLTILVQRFGF